MCILNISHLWEREYRYLTATGHSSGLEESMMKYSNYYIKHQQLNIWGISVTFVSCTWPLYLPSLFLSLFHSCHPSVSALVFSHDVRSWHVTSRIRTEKELRSRNPPAHLTLFVPALCVCLVCAGLFMLQCCSAWALRCLTASRFTSVRECYRVNTQTRRRRVKQNCNQRRQTFITLDYFGLFSSEPFYLVFILICCVFVRSAYSLAHRVRSVVVCFRR